MLSNNEIQNYFENIYFKKYTQGQIRYIDKNILNICKNKFDDAENIHENIYRIIHNINIRPICEVCGGPVKFIGSFMNGGFCKTCGSKCAANHPDTLIKRKKTCLEKYGTEFVCQVDDFKEKVKQTCMEKYGGPSPASSKDIVKKIKNTKYERYGDENYTNDIKRIQTMNTRYGCSYTLELKAFRDLASQIIKQRYGVQYAAQSEVVKEKYKKTCLKRYGVDNIYKSKEFLENMKIKQTEIIEKRNKTLKQNKSFKQSKDEKRCYEILSKIFPDIKTQYSTDSYPFKCDFYIPSQNLYIEYNGSHFHHNHPFNPENENDIIELNRLIECATKYKMRTKKTKSQYDNIIYTWTDLDVRKRNIANKNNLNYIEFWNVEDVLKWVEIWEK